jgi:HEPN domain-containing protein
MKKEASKWIHIGENELGYAKLGLKSNDFYSQVCAEAHQAVEKFLKAYLVERNSYFKKTHDLVWLVNKCADIDADFKKFEEDCEFMSDFFIELRYPDMLSDRTHEEAKRACKAADRVHDFILVKIT